MREIEADVVVVGGGTGGYAAVFTVLYYKLLNLYREALDKMREQSVAADRPQVLVEADCPLAGTDEWAARPGVVTPQPKLVLAGDGVRCELHVALMERAATTGFQAANALLRHWGLPGHELWSVPTRARFPRSLRAARAALRLRERGLTTVGRDSSGRGR